MSVQLCRNELDPKHLPAVLESMKKVHYLCSQLLFVIQTTRTLSLPLYSSISLFILPFISLSPSLPLHFSRLPPLQCGKLNYLSFMYSRCTINKLINKLLQSYYLLLSGFGILEFLYSRWPQGRTQWPPPFSSRRLTNWSNYYYFINYYSYTCINTYMYITDTHLQTG